MVNFNEMSPEQALIFLRNQQKKARDRQRAYVQKQKNSGMRRVNAFISPEAGKILDTQIVKTGKGTADILNDALLMLAQNYSGKTVMNQTKGHAVAQTVCRAANPDYKKEKTENYIMQLDASGLSQSAIAAKLNKEKWPTQRTGGKWYHKAVGTIIKRQKRQIS